MDQKVEMESSEGIRDVTGEEVREAATKAGVTYVEHHDCGMCGYMCNHTVEDGQPFFDAGCDCVRSPPPPRPVSWDSIAEQINMQSTAKWKIEIARQWGVTLTKSITPPAQA